MIRRPPRSTQSRSSAASDVYKRQEDRKCAEKGPVTDPGMPYGCSAKPGFIPVGTYLWEEGWRSGWDSRASKYYYYKCDLCLLYTSPSPRDRTRSRMPSSA
eukprot:TRINITY_DN10649_c0_g1_i1.p1 TRINITY_DN10649_c0_g1~~TRINITY_DN10649_c0_g1_i1.p1  ORF type:complete len:101 (+),score=62.57 TRINITY_DN10649_c0_g1_i1:39-341(+)